MKIPNIAFRTQWGGRVIVYVLAVIFVCGVLPTGALLFSDYLQHQRAKAEESKAPVMVDCEVSRPDPANPDVMLTHPCGQGQSPLSK